MRSLIAAAVLASSLCWVPAFAGAPAGVDMKKLSSHLKEHQKYPATRKQLLEACFDLKDFSEVEKKWFITTLPDRTFKSADDVVSALNAAE
jgi:hypothetical protein